MTPASSESESTVLDSSSLDMVGCMSGCNGAIANSGLAIFMLAGLSVINFLRKRR